MRTDLSRENYREWLDLAFNNKSWTVLAINSVEGSSWGREPVPEKIFIQFLDYLMEKRKYLWIATFGEIGAYWRAQVIFEKAKKERSGSQIKVIWEKPNIFPSGVILKIKVEDQTVVVSQKGLVIKPIEKDVYPIAFDDQEMNMEIF